MVLIVDEAHNLEWEVLEEIRLLGNLENRNGKLLQIILAGQPELDRKLDAPNLRQLKQRIVLRCNLQPFTLRDAVEYIESRLEKPGMHEQDIFSEELMAEIHVRAQGIPRVINAICDNLLLTAFALEIKTCTTRHAGRSVQGHAPRMAGKPPGPRARAQRTQLRADSLLVFRPSPLESQSAHPRCHRKFAAPSPPSDADTRITARDDAPNGSASNRCR